MKTNKDKKLRDAKACLLYSFRSSRHRNDNLDGSDLQMSFKVIKSGTNRKLVYDFLSVLCSNFFRIMHWRNRLRQYSINRGYEKFDVKQSNDLEISPRSSTVV